MSTQRPFDPDTDIVRIRDFIASLVAQAGQDRVMHIGDWLWQIHLREDTLPAATENLRIWTDDGGQIQGFCWYRSNGMEIQVDPTASPAGKIEREMLSWAISRHAVASSTSPSNMYANAFERDARKIAILSDLGFRDTGEERYDLFFRPFESDRPEPELPTGAIVRAIDIEQDLDDRVAIHQEVWHPSRFSATSYRAVRAAPGFLPELDLVAVAPDGTIAAYCICWYDPVNRIGEFEPVGTRSAFRRQGYGLAVMREGLRRLQALGAAHAMVASSATNEASYGLYVRSGFTVVGQDHSFARPAGPPASP